MGVISHAGRTVMVGPPSIAAAYLRGLEGAAVVFVLSGTLTVSGGRDLRAGGAVFLPSPEPLHGSDRTLLGVLTLSRGSASAQRLVYAGTGLAHYERLAASMSPVTLGAAGGSLAPWSLYSVVLHAIPEPIVLHVHRHVSNILLIRGEPGRQVGVALVRDQRGTTWSRRLWAGDLVFVPTGVVHAVIPLEGDELGMFVVNDGPAEYEDADLADFEHTEHAARAADCEEALELPGGVTVQRA